MKNVPWHPRGWAEPRASSCATAMASDTAALHTARQGAAANKPQFKILQITKHSFE